MKNILKIGFLSFLLALAPVQNHAQTIQEDSDSVRASRRELLEKDSSKIRPLTVEELRRRHEKACDEPLFDASGTCTL